MPGPPPKDPAQRRRRNATPGFRQLPREGRQGPTPEWPLLPHPEPLADHLERQKWEELWKLPQAVEWERMRVHPDVALYVRFWVEASAPMAPSTTVTELRQLDAKIGVSPKAMRDLRWEIADDPATSTDEVEQKRSEKPRIYAPPVQAVG